MHFKTFPFVADVVDGKILEFPKLFYLQCEWVRPLGNQIVRQYSKTQCIVAKKVFQIYYQGQVFGSSQFTSVMQFDQYLSNVCRYFCTPARITINGCNLTRYGCNVIVYQPCPSGRLFKRWGCSVTRYGCTVKLN